MGNKKLIAFIALMLFVFVLANASALKATNANIKMTLRGAVGEEITRSITAINENPERVIVKLTPMGDLADNVELTETEFELGPGEKKKVFFTIYADEAGRTETKVNVIFSAVSGEGNTVGLPTSITFFATGESSTITGDDADEIDGTDDGSTVIEDDETEGKPIGISNLTLLLIVGIVLIVLLIILLAFASKRGRGNKERLRRPRA